MAVRPKFPCRCRICGKEVMLLIPFGDVCNECAPGIIGGLQKTHETIQMHVLLDCEGKPSCGKWEPHTFVKDSRAEGLKDGKPQITHNAIYRCDKCGAKRKFGAYSCSVQSLIGTSHYEAHMESLRLEALANS